MNFIRFLSGDTEITNYAHSKKDYVLAADDISSEGFHVQKKGSLVPHIFDKGAKGAKIWTKSPCDGEYYIALQVRDTYGTYDEEYIPVEDEACGPFDERVVELSVDGKKKGFFRFGTDDKKYYFFVTEEPISLNKGTEISYEVLAGEKVLFTAVVLMKERPAIQSNRIMNLTTKNGEVRFWTPVACRVRLLLEDRVLSEDIYLNNHRFTVPEELWGVRFIIETVDESGNVLCGRGTCRRTSATEQKNEAISVELGYQKQYQDIRPAMTVLPLEQGQCYDGTAVYITDEQGNRYLTQNKETARWQDGSLRTVALSGNLPLDGRKFRIETAKAALSETGEFSAQEDSDGVTVISGGKTYRFSNANDSVLPDKVLIAALYTAEGERYVATGGSYVIEEQGNHHIVVTRINRFMNGNKRNLKCLCHMHFYRDMDAYRLEFGFENDLMEEEFAVISGMYLEGDGMRGETMAVFQIDEDTLVKNGAELTERCDGRFTVDGAPMILEDFWQNYPKAYNGSENSVKIGICPFIIKPEHYSEEEFSLQARLYFYLKTGNYEFHGGMRKYHSIIFGKDAEKLSDIPFLAPDSKVVQESLAFGRIQCGCPDFPNYDTYMDNSLELYYTHNKQYRDYGMLNYGDSFGEGNIHWTNLEYDFNYGLLVHYLRTGDERFYQLAKIGAAHYAEIDTCHRSIRYEENGYYFVHTVGHANNYYPHEMIPKSYPKIKFQMGHMFNHGLSAFYMMTGIERYKETVVACADALAKYYTVKFDFLTEREPGWCMLALEAAYEITLDEYYLNACRIIAERVLQKQDKDTGCVRYLMPMPPKEGVTNREFCYGGKPFMHGVLGSALKYYYYLTKDKRIYEVAMGIARWLVDTMYDDTMHEFWYSTAFRLAERRVSQPETSIEILDVVLFACLEGKEEYLEVARKAFQKMVESPYRFEYDVAKVFAMRLRFSPEIMYDYHKAKEQYKK